MEHTQNSHKTRFSRLDKILVIWPVAEPMVRVTNKSSAIDSPATQKGRKATNRETRYSHVKYFRAGDIGHTEQGHTFFT